MDSEIFDENLYLSDYPENTNFSFAENYSTQSNGAPSDLSMDYSADFTLLERKIWVTRLLVVNSAEKIKSREYRGGLCGITCVRSFLEKIQADFWLDADDTSELELLTLVLGNNL